MGLRHQIALMLVEDIKEIASGDAIVPGDDANRLQEISDLIETFEANDREGGFSSVAHEPEIPLVTESGKKAYCWTGWHIVWWIAIVLLLFVASLVGR